MTVKAAGPADRAPPLITASLKVEGAIEEPLEVGSRSGRLTLGPDRFFDGRVFDPSRLADYLAGFRGE